MIHASPRSIVYRQLIFVLLRRNCLSHCFVTLPDGFARVKPETAADPIAVPPHGLKASQEARAWGVRLGSPHGGKRATWLVWSASDKGGLPESPMVSVSHLTVHGPRASFCRGSRMSWRSCISPRATLIYSLHAHRLSGPLSILPQASLRPHDCRKIYQISPRTERIISRPRPTARVVTAGSDSL